MHLCYFMYISVFLARMSLCQLYVWCLQRSEDGILFHVTGNGHSHRVGVVLISVRAEQTVVLCSSLLDVWLGGKPGSCLGLIKLNSTQINSNQLKSSQIKSNQNWQHSPEGGRQTLTESHATHRTALQCPAQTHAFYHTRQQGWRMSPRACHPLGEPAQEPPQCASM